VEVIPVLHSEASESEDSDLEGSGNDGAVSSGEEWSGVTAKDAWTQGRKALRPPTGQELEEIKEASDLFQSSTFKLQVCMYV